MNAPDRGTPDRGTPERGTPERGTPDRGTPERGTPDRGTPERGCENDVAPYILGALEPRGARVFADHLLTCDACRDEVAALMPVLDVLASGAPRYEVSAALRRRVMDAVRSEPKIPGVTPRRPRLRLPQLWPRRSALVGALAVAIATTVVIAVGPGASPVRVIQASLGQAQLRVAGDHGELIVDHLRPAPPDRVYEMWLERANATPAPSTLFAVTSRGTAVLGVPGELTGVTGVLVTLEPTGGSRAPTTRPVILARLV